MSQDTAALALPSFPLSICNSCNGTGSRQGVQEIDCFTCGGHGYSWKGLPVTKGWAPNEQLTELIMPCCKHAFNALWENARKKFAEYHRLRIMIIHGNDAREELNRLTRDMRSPTVVVEKT